MAVYKFRVLFEDDDQVHRDIEISSTQNFTDFRQAILNAYSIGKDWDSVFYVSDDKWHKVNEVVAFPRETKPDEVAGGKQRLVKFIDDPHQRFLYSVRSLTEVVFLVELVKILPDSPKTVYPRTAATVGEFPKQFFNMLNGVKEETNKTFLDPELAEFDAKMASLDSIDEPGEDELEDADSLIAEVADLPEGEVEITAEGETAVTEESEEIAEGDIEFGEGEEGGFEDMISDEEA
ncbi:MAG: hypothetical protein POELPBGB_03429 [Bacteroidia bacterium]|nr:hypothetical protein [Bacteroidia bacterium]